MIDAGVARGPYFLCAILIAIGIYLMMREPNLFKVLMGLYLVQSGVILFFIFLATRQGGTVPILAEASLPPPHNPLPHALMLTAIVVGVATQGVGLSLLIRLHREVGAIDDAA